MIPVDDYYRQERLRKQVEYEIAAENARVARFATLDETLAEVLYLDAAVIDGADRETLARARQIICELRQVW